MNGNPSLHLWLIPLLPLIGFLVNGALGRRLSKALVSSVALVFTAAPLAIVARIAVVFGRLRLPYLESLPFEWISASTFHASFAFMVDQLTLIMLLVVTGVGFLIHFTRLVTWRMKRDTGASCLCWCWRRTFCSE